MCKAENVLNNEAAEEPCNKHIVKYLSERNDEFIGVAASTWPLHLK